MASLLRAGNCISRCILNLKSAKGIPVAISSSSTSLWNSRKLQHEHFRTLITDAAPIQVNDTVSRSRFTLDEGLQRLDATVRRMGRITRRDFNEVFQELKNEGVASPLQSLLVLRCCGAVLSEELPQVRNELVAEVLDTLKSIGTQLDVSHYNAVLKVYVENEYKVDPVDFLSQLEKKGIAPNRVTYQRLVELYCQSGDVEGAGKVLEHMKQKGIPVSEKIFSSLIMGHGRARDLESAKEVLDMMRSVKVEPTAEAFVTLICACAENGNVKAMNQYLEEMRQKNIELLNIDYFNIIYALAKSNTAQDNEHLIEKLKNTMFGFINECILISQKLVNIGHHEVAFRLLMLIEPLTKPTGESVPTGSYFLRHLVQNDVDAEVILEYCQKMKELKIHPFGLQRVAEFSLMCGKHDHFITFLKALEKEGYSIRPHFFWPIFAACRKTKNSSNVYKTLNLMTNEFHCPTNYSTFVDYVYPALFADDVVVVQDVIKRLKDAGYSVNESVGALVEYLVENRKLKEAVALVDEYDFVLKPRSLYLPLASAYVDTKDVASTIKLLKRLHQSARLEIGRSASTDWTGLFLVQCLRFGSQYPEALEQLINALKQNDLSISHESLETIQLRFGGSLTSSTKSVLNDISTLETKTSLDLSADDPHEMSIEELEAHLIELKSKGMNTRGVLRKLLIHHCRHKNTKRVEEIQADMEQMNFVYSPAMIAQLMDISITNEDLEGAKKYFGQLKDISDFMTDDYKILNYAALLVKTNQVEEAKTILTSWQPAHHSDDDFLESNVWRLLNSCAEKGDAQLAEEMLKLIIDKKCCKISNVILGPVVKSYLQAGDVEKAIAKFEEFAKTYSCTPWRNDLFVKLIEKEDQKNLQKIVDINNEIHGELNTLHDLAFSFIDCNKTADARRLFMTPGMRARQFRLERRCERYLKEGKLRELEDLIKVTSDIFDIDRDKLYLCLIRSYYQTKEPKKALEVWTMMQEEDVQPSPTTLVFLANFLKEFNEPVPFAIPDEQAILTPPSQETRTRSRLAASSKLTSETALKVSQTSAEIRLLAEQGNLEGAMNLIQNMLKEKLYPLPRVLRYVLNEVARKGDIDSLKALEPYMNESLKEIINFKNLSFNAHIHRGTYEEVLGEFERDPSNITACPAGSFMRLLELHPELEERVEKLAKEYTKHDYHALLNVVWMHHFINGNYKVADRIFKETPAFLNNFGFRSVLRAAEEGQNVAMLERLVEVVKQTQLPGDALGRIYDCLMNVQVAVEDIDGASKTLETAQKSGVEHCINSNTIQKLRSGLQRSGQCL